MPPSPWHQVPVAGEASVRAVPRRWPPMRRSGHVPEARVEPRPLVGERALAHRCGSARRRSRRYSSSSAQPMPADAVREPAEVTAVATRGVRPGPAVRRDRGTVDQLVAGRDRVLDQRRVVERVGQRQQREDRPGAAENDVRAAVGTGGRPGLGDDACVRPSRSSSSLQEHGGTSGRPRDAERAGVEPVATVERHRRRSRDGLTQRSEGRATDGGVAGHGGELREEQADARCAVVEVRLECAVLVPPRHGGIHHDADPVAAAVVPDRIGHDAIGRSTRPRRGTRRQRTCRPASDGSR